MAIHDGKRSSSDRRNILTIQEMAWLNFRKTLACCPACAAAYPPLVKLTGEREQLSPWRFKH